MGAKGVGRQLADECRRARKQAGLDALEIAHAAGVSQATISRFEVKGLWPLNVERIVSAYERECNLPPNELWRRAILDS